MRVIFRTTQAFVGAAHRDLARPHPFAAERVAFITVRAALARRSLLLLAEGYHPVADEDYVNDPRVGAMMGQEAIRKALNLALLQEVGVVHVHEHGHHGRPGFSRVDLSEQLRFVPDFFSVRPEMPHGALVLSHNRAAGRVWFGPERIEPIAEFNVMGPRILIDDANLPERRGAVA
jgi:hypothetical protein